MGANSNKGPVPVKQQLANVRHRTEDRVGKAKVTGRYHLPPRNIKDDYDMDGKVLGTGLNGSVILARDKVTREEVAVKPYTSVGINKEEQRVLRNEVEIFLAMDSPHIARLLNVYEELDKLMLVMEICKGGDVFEFVQSHGHFNEKKAADILYQMLMSVNYLHDRKIVHRDLKLDNFLFESKAHEYVKLIDFGMSRYWTNNKKMKLACGTMGYIAPECLNESYDIKCDMWSMGVIAFVLLAGEMPFTGSENEQIAAIKACRFSMDGPEWKGISENARDFVRKLMTADVEARLSAEDALKHPFIADRDTLDRTTSGEVDKGIVHSLQSFSKVSKFRRACLTVTAYAMTLEERRAVRDSFESLDVDKTGKIKLSELKTVLRPYLTDAEAQAMLEQLDDNNDQTIHYTDFLAAMMTNKIALNEMHIRAAFERLDADSSGFITVANLREVLGDEYRGEDVKKLMKDADMDGTGKISYEEFMVYMQSEEATEEEQEVLLQVVDSYKSKASSGGTPSPKAGATLPTLVESTTAPAAASAPQTDTPPAATKSPAAADAQPAENKNTPPKDGEPVPGGKQGSCACTLQ